MEVPFLSPIWMPYLLRSSLPSFLLPSAAAIISGFNLIRSRDLHEGDLEARGKIDYAFLGCKSVPKRCLLAMVDASWE